MPPASEQVTSDQVVLTPRSRTLDRQLETLTESTSDASDKTAATLGGNTVALGAGVELEAPRHLLAYRAAWQTGASVTVCIPG